MLERRGLGAYGAVYRAIGAEKPSGPVALKLALHPRDERFSREVELLSRIRHPSVPRLVDHGLWYRSPEAWRSVRLPLPEPAVTYAPGPADDIFALGVTAFRLVTGEYPYGVDPASGSGHLDGVGLPSAQEVNPRCHSELSRLTSRMLSVSPEVRGSARALAEALEVAFQQAGPEADMSLFVPEAPRLVEAPSHRHLVPPAPGRARRPWRVAAGVAGALALGAGGLLNMHLAEESRKELAAKFEETKDGGTVAVGDSALTAPVPVARAPSAWSTLALEVPPKPFPGQRRPDANGRCPGKSHVPIHGGCWRKVAVDPKDCDEGSYWYKGACYMPVFPPPAPPTSSPARSPDHP